VRITTQSHNVAGGDIVGGDKVITHNYTLSVDGSSAFELSLLYAKLKDKENTEPAEEKICEALEHYFNSSTGSDVRGLEEKLKSSGREDQIQNAKQLKEKAAMAVMRYQSSRTAQRIYTIIFTELHTKFELLVTPMIQEDQSRVNVDEKILFILDKTKQMLGENLLEINVRDLFGLLYFLGGNCHIRWDKC
jgi:hypothetical protein